MILLPWACTCISDGREAYVYRYRQQISCVLAKPSAYKYHYPRQRRSAGGRSLRYSPELRRGLRSFFLLIGARRALVRSTRHAVRRAYRRPQRERRLQQTTPRRTTHALGMQAERETDKQTTAASWRMWLLFFVISASLLFPSHHVLLTAGRWILAPLS